MTHGWDLSSYTDAELIALRVECKKSLTQLAAGGTISSINAPGLSFTRSTGGTSEQSIRALLRAVTVTLQQRDPDTYGTPPTRRTLAIFR
jgi:hypothetical protein